VRDILKLKENYGFSNTGNGEKVNIEYVSANPTGPLHLGHTRGAVFGDVLAKLLSKNGYDVCKEYYINDAGGQVDILVQSAYLRYKEALGEDIGKIPEGLYPGEYLCDVGKKLAERYDDSLKSPSEEFSAKACAESYKIVKEFVLSEMLAIIRSNLEELGVEHDIFSSEKTLSEKGAVEDVLKFLEGKGLIYKGVLEPPKGMKPDDWEPRPQTLFKSTNFGDDVDRALKKSDGSWTYFAPDIAYHYDKYKRGFSYMIDVLGADHGGYVKRIRSATKAVSEGNAELYVKICQLVNLMENGKPVKMSKRSGNLIEMKEIIDEVGKDAVRFMMLTRTNDTVIDFDFAKVKEQSKDNPIFYVQYAHARISSVMRHAKEMFGEDFGDKLIDADLSQLNREQEIEIIKMLAGYYKIVESSLKHQEPHRMVYFLIDLASSFHSLWNSGKEDEVFRFIIEKNEKITYARLALLKAIAIIIASALDIIGIKPTEEMR
jgi:arginyl-tRNA synthetase